MKVRLLAVMVTALAFLALTAPTLAHEGREAGGYQIEFGWRNEPAYVGLLNGPEIYMSVVAAHEHDEAAATETADHEEEHSHETTPIAADVPIDLKVEVSFGDQRMAVPMRPAWGEVGHLVGELIPTRAGDYTFHITGTIGDTPVDETFTSADGQFGTVEPIEDIMFPKAA